jgi:hypothetical protein
LGAQALVSNSGVIKTLALADELRKELHELIKETIRQGDSIGSAKVLCDVFETMNPRHLVGILLTDLDLYQDIHLVLD